MRTTAQDPSVGRRFSAAAGSYDRHANAQRLAAGHLLACLGGTGLVRRILEAGCGTGYLTRALAERFRDATIDALDLSAPMVAAARAICPAPERVRWHVCDLTHYRSERPADLLASNAALHWIEPWQSSFAAARRLLCPGGILACSLMVRGTLRELHESRHCSVPHKPPRRPLPDPSELRAAVAANGFRIEHVETRSFRTHHPSARAMLQALHDMGLTGGPFSRATAPLTRGELRRLEEAYQDRYGAEDGGVFATYEVGFVRAVREP